MRANRDGKAVVPGNGGYDIEVVEVTGPPDRMMGMPPAKSRGRLIPMGTGEDLPDRPSPVPGRGPFARRKKHSKTSLVPTWKEVKQLPRWARVAFAARCGRRVLPAVRYFWEGASEHHLIALAEGVSAAENAPPITGNAFDSALAADAVALTANPQRRPLRPSATGAYFAAAAARASLAALAAHSAHAAAVHTEFDAAAAGCAAAGFLASVATIDTPLTAQLRCIRRDFVRLKRLALKEKWTDDTPVLPDVFGPMWPEGVEPYWAVEPPPAPAGG